MDHFFHEPILQFDDADFFLYDVSPVIQSSFIPYTRGPGSEIGVDNSSGTNGPNIYNVNKRMLEFVRRSWAVRNGTREQANGRCYRHMVSERLRRERERTGYLALHSVLPLGTKNDKHSIVQTAVRGVQEMKGYKAMLEKKNSELEGKLASLGSGSVGSAKISFRVANPTSGVDSLLEVLKCLKSLGSKTTSVQSKFCDQELEAAIGVDSEIEGAEVEKAVQRTLLDVEKKLRSHFPQS